MRSAAKWPSKSSPNRDTQRSRIETPPQLRRPIRPRVICAGFNARSAGGVTCQRAERDQFRLSQVVAWTLFDGGVGAQYTYPAQSRAGRLSRHRPRRVLISLKRRTSSLDCRHRNRAEPLTIRRDEVKLETRRCSAISSASEQPQTTVLIVGFRQTKAYLLVDRWPARRTSSRGSNDSSLKMVCVGSIGEMKIEICDEDHEISDMQFGSTIAPRDGETDRVERRIRLFRREGACAGGCVPVRRGERPTSDDGEKRRMGAACDASRAAADESARKTETQGGRGRRSAGQARRQSGSGARRSAARQEPQPAYIANTDSNVGTDDARAAGPLVKAVHVLRD